MTFTFSIILLSYAMTLKTDENACIRQISILVHVVVKFQLLKAFGIKSSLRRKKTFIQNPYLTLSLVSIRAEFFRHLCAESLFFSHYIIISPTYRTTYPIFRIKDVNNACAHVDSRVTIYIARKNVIQRCVLCLNCIR